jgi:sulfite exporter TauE/SafE
MAIGGALFLWLSLFGVFNLSFAFPERPPLSVVLLIGLAAGISTCMALIGGLVLGISSRFAEMHPEASGRARFLPHLFFQAGRVGSFVVLGGLVGSLGGVIGISGTVTGVLIVLAGFLMLFLGISLTDLFPRLTFSRFTLPSGIARALGIGNEEGYSHRSSVVLGALTFFLPCGFTQAMQLYAASTGSFVSGALVMGAFALGTMPGLLGIGGLVSVVRGSLGRIFFKMVALVLILLGVIQVGNGLRLFGINLLPSPQGSSVVSEENAGMQVIRMTQQTAGYTPSRFTVKKGIPVRWIIDSKDSYTCAAYLVAPAIGVSQTLKKGENVIEFTPDRAETIGFNCAMGMYRGTIVVTD